MENLRLSIDDAIETEIQRCDYTQQVRNRDYNTILSDVAKEVSNRLRDECRAELEESDRAFIQSKVGPLVDHYLSLPFKARFEKFDRVVCKIGGEHGWAPGTIQALLEDDPSDPTGRTKLPYVVKLDPPVGRLISVPYDENQICRAEVCFGRMSKGDLGFTVRCRPQKMNMKSYRFDVGDRVACAVEDATGYFTDWAPGKVVDVNFDVAQDAAAEGVSWNFAGEAGIMPYRVLLDGDAGPTHVFVHRDVHWLIRDLALQPPAPRQAEDGARNMKRLIKRRRGDSEVVLIDHMTRRVRIEPAGDDSSEEEDS